MTNYTETIKSTTNPSSDRTKRDRGRDCAMQYINVYILFLPGEGSIIMVPTNNVIRRKTLKPTVNWHTHTHTLNMTQISISKFPQHRKTKLLCPCICVVNFTNALHTASSHNNLADRKHDSTQDTHTRSPGILQPTREGRACSCTGTSCILNTYTNNSVLFI